MSFLTELRGESRATLALAIPIIAGQLSQMLMGIVDAAMVGKVGFLPLAAAAFANNLASLPMMFGIGLLSSLSVRISHAHGAGRHDESGEYLRHGLLLAILLSLVLTAGVCVIGQNLDRFGQKPDVVLEARTFYLLLGASLLPALGAMALKGFCESLGHPWAPTLILFGAIPLNVFLNWILIYGNLGVPALGLDGAGWATLASRWAAFAVLLLYVLGSAHTRTSLPKKWASKLEFARLKSLLLIGLPAAFQILLEAGAFVMGAILMGWIGEKALAAHQIALACAGTTFMVPLGLAMATTVRIGQAIGAGHRDRVRIIGLNSFALSTCFMLCTATCFVVFGHFIANHFVNDAEVTNLAARLLLLTALFQIFDGLQVTAAGALRGISDAVVPMLICLGAYWAVALPLGYLAAFHLGWGAMGIWSGFVLGLGLVASLLVWRFLGKTAVLVDGATAMESRTEATIDL